MIVKERGEEVMLEKLVSLTKRLPENHLKRDLIERDMKMKWAEVNGERSLDYPLKFIVDDVLILRDLRIEDDEGFFQIDILLISKEAIIIVEVKNWSGTLLFAENYQVIRVHDRQREGFQSPILQVKLQQHRLRRFLRANNFTDIPISYLIVISFPSTIIRPASPSCMIPDEVIYGNQLFSRVGRILGSLPNLVSNDEMWEMAELLKRRHVPPRNDVMAKYNLGFGDLLKGVICPDCGFLPMERRRNKWLCNQCKHTSNSAHLSAIADYKLLVGNTTTNGKMREFLRLDSRHVTRNILLEQCVAEYGTRQGRKYLL